MPRLFVLTLAMILLLSACRQVPAGGQPAPGGETSVPPVTVTSQVTVTSSPAPSNTPALTLTPTLTPTPAPVGIPLEELSAMSVEQVAAQVKEMFGFEDFFVQNGVVIETATGEMGDLVTGDKIMLSTPKEVAEFTRETIPAVFAHGNLIFRQSEDGSKWTTESGLVEGTFLETYGGRLNAFFLHGGIGNMDVYYSPYLDIIYDFSKMSPEAVNAFIKDYANKNGNALARKALVDGGMLQVVIGEKNQGYQIFGGSSVLKLDEQPMVASRGELGIFPTAYVSKDGTVVVGTFWNTDRFMKFADRLDAEFNTATQKMDAIYIGRAMESGSENPETMQGTVSGGEVNDALLRLGLKISEIF